MSSSALAVAAKTATNRVAVPSSAGELLSSWWMSMQSAIQGFIRRPRTGEASPSPGLFRDPLTPSTGHRVSAPPFAAEYFHKLEKTWHEHDWSSVVTLISALRSCWQDQRQVFLCGNGGSAANAIHLANDLLYGVDKSSGQGLRVTALPANAAVLTCLANDVSYADVFAQQLSVLANPGDLLVVFSGSGNSANILKALERARELGLTSFAILGFDGGRALPLADHAIHFPVHDMQVAEDLQMMVGHMAMQALSRRGR